LGEVCTRGRAPAGGQTGRAASATIRLAPIGRASLFRGRNTTGPTATRNTSCTGWPIACRLAATDSRIVLARRRARTLVASLAGPRAAPARRLMSLLVRERLRRQVGRDGHKFYPHIQRTRPVAHKLPRTQAAPSCPDDFFEMTSAFDKFLQIARRHRRALGPH